MDDPIWDSTVFTKNQDRLLQGDVVQAFFAAVLTQARQANLMSAEHVPGDGTLLDAWASHKRFQPKDTPTPPTDDDPSNPTVDFRGELRRHDTHQSMTDPDAQLVRKSKGQAATLVHPTSTIHRQLRRESVCDRSTTLCSGVFEHDEHGKAGWSGEEPREGARRFSAGGSAPPFGKGL